MPPVRSAGGGDDFALLSLRKMTLAVDPKVGVGPRGIRSYYARALAFRRSYEPEANGAFFTRLGVLYLNTRMPPWLRSLLGSAPLVPLAKNPHVPEEEIDARHTKAEDTDTALLCKLQTDQTPKCKPRERLRAPPSRS